MKMFRLSQIIPLGSAGAMDVADTLINPLPMPPNTSIQALDISMKVILFLVGIAPTIKSIFQKRKEKQQQKNNNKKPQKN